MQKAPTARVAQSALGYRSLAPPVRLPSRIQSRNIQQDVFITRTGAPLIKTQGGRSALGGHTATVFGATGFVGRYIVHRLAKQGCNVVVPYREEMAKRHLKVTGDLGRVTFMEYDLRNTQSIEESVRHSDVVYNLVGRTYPTKNFSYEDVHIDGLERIAEAVAKYDVDRFIHVSSYNADLNSPSEFFRTKARGEQLARQIYPEATIVRPAPVFGTEDNLLHKLAGVTNLFTSNWMQERYWPVHAHDIGHALELMLYDESSVGSTYELYGPKNYSTAEIAELVDREIVKKRRHINLPKPVMKALANALNKLLWWHTTSPDEVEMEFLDQKIDPTAKTFKDLGIEPAELSAWTYHYLTMYRSSQYYDLPPATEREKREEKKYFHVLDDHWETEKGAVRDTPKPSTTPPPLHFRLALSKRFPEVRQELATMLIPKADRKLIHEYLFREGVLVAKKDFNLPKHGDIDTKNLYVIKACQSLTSRGYLKTRFSWQYYYYTLTPEGLDYLREWLHVPAEIVPATHIKTQRSHAPPRGMLGGEEERRGGFRGGPRGDGGYRRREQGEGKEGGAPGDFAPTFRGGFGRGRGAAPPS